MTTGSPTSSGLFHTAKMIISFVLLVSVLIWIFQIVVEQPAERGIKTCFLPYKLYSVIFIHAPQIILPQDAQLPLRNALRGERYYKLCVVYTSLHMPFYAYPDHIAEFAQARQSNKSVN